MPSSKRRIDMLFGSFDRSQFALAYCAHICNYHFRVRLLIFVKVELVREKSCPCPKLGPTDFFILKLTFADPSRVAVVARGGCALTQGQGARCESCNKQVAVKVQEEVEQEDIDLIILHLQQEDYQFQYKVIQ